MRATPNTPAKISARPVTLATASTVAVAAEEFQQGSPTVATSTMTPAQSTLAGAPRAARKGSHQSRAHRMQNHTRRVQLPHHQRGWPTPKIKPERPCRDRTEGLGRRMRKRAPSNPPAPHLSRNPGRSAPKDQFRKIENLSSSVNAFLRPAMRPQLPRSRRARRQPRQTHRRRQGRHSRSDQKIKYKTLLLFALSLKPQHKSTYSSQEYIRCINTVRSPLYIIIDQM